MICPHCHKKFYKPRKRKPHVPREKVTEEAYYYARKLYRTGRYTLRSAAYEATAQGYKINFSQFYYRLKGLTKI